MNNDRWSLVNQFTLDRASVSFFNFYDISNVFRLSLTSQCLLLVISHINVMHTRITLVQFTFPLEN